MPTVALTGVPALGFAAPATTLSVAPLGVPPLGDIALGADLAQTLWPILQVAAILGAQGTLGFATSGPAGMIGISDLQAVRAAASGSASSALLQRIIWLTLPTTLVNRLPGFGRSGEGSRTLGAPRPVQAPQLVPTAATSPIQTGFMQSLEVLGTTHPFGYGYAPSAILLGGVLPLTAPVARAGASRGIALLYGGPSQIAITSPEIQSVRINLGGIYGTIQMDWPTLHAIPQQPGKPVSLAGSHLLFGYTSLDSATVAHLGTLSGGVLECQLRLANGEWTAQAPTLLTTLHTVQDNPVSRQGGLGRNIIAERTPGAPRPTTSTDAQTNNRVIFILELQDTLLMATPRFMSMV